jgi:hypothetical protein
VLYLSYLALLELLRKAHVDHLVSIGEGKLTRHSRIEKEVSVLFPTSLGIEIMGHCKDKVGADEKASTPGEVSATIAKAEIAVAVVRILVCISGVKDFNGIAKVDLVKELLISH